MTRCRAMKCLTPLGWLALFVGVTTICAGADNHPKNIPQSHSARLLCWGTNNPVLVRVEFEGAADGRKKYFRNLFDWLNRDGDNGLSSEEAQRIPVSGRITVARPRWENLPEVEQQTRFAAADLNHDGKISLVEFERLLESQWVLATLSIRTPNLAQSVPLLKRLDQDHDGRLSLDELKRGFEILLDSDFDDDESLSLMELQPVPNAYLPAAAVEASPLAELIKSANSPTEVSMVIAAMRLRIPTSPRLQELLSELPATAPADDIQNELRDWIERAPPDLAFRCNLLKNSLSLVRKPRDPELVQLLDSDQSQNVSLVADHRAFDFEIRDNRDVIRGAQGFFKQQFRRADADKNDYLTPAEFGQLALTGAEFAVIDADGNGRLTLPELQRFLECATLETLSVIQTTLIDETQPLFELIDQNRDRRLTRRDLLKACERFAELDLNGDGHLSDGEHTEKFRIRFSYGMPTLFAQTARAQNTNRNPTLGAEEAGPVWFQRMDRNRDGEISWREFLGPRSAFDRLDANHDGAIDVNEAERANNDGSR